MGHPFGPTKTNKPVIGSRNRSERPGCAWPSVQAFRLPSTCGCLIDISHAQLAECGQQMIPQGSIQVDAAHLEHTIFQPLLGVVSKGHRPTIRVDPIASLDLSFLEGQPAHGIRLASEGMRSGS